jgi:hypothetical protein
MHWSPRGHDWAAPLQRRNLRRAIAAAAQRPVGGGSFDPSALDPEGVDKRALALSHAEVAYIEALQRSFGDFYEVRRVDVGKGLELRNLRNGDEVFVRGRVNANRAEPGCADCAVRADDAMPAPVQPRRSGWRRGRACRSSGFRWSSHSETFRRR